MKNTVFAAVAVCSIVASQAFAGGNSANAKAMAENIKTYGGNLATAIKPGSDLDAGKGNYGWGNAGSALTGDGTVDGLVDGGGNFATGNQVSKSGKNK